jgi:hypothetical protein
MQDHVGNMDYPNGKRAPAKTEFLVSCYNTPSERARRLFYVVVRAGHLRSVPEYRVERDHLPGHDLLLCLSGSGFVVTGNRRFKVEPEEMAWISGQHPHAHRANQADPWELLWLRIDGRTMEETCNILSVPRLPVFSGIPIETSRREFLGSDCSFHASELLENCSFRERDGSRITLPFIGDLLLLFL